MDTTKGTVWYCANRPTPVLRQHKMGDLWVKKEHHGAQVIHRWDGRDWVRIMPKTPPKPTASKSQLYPSPSKQERAARRQAKRETFPFAVDYDLAYDGGGAAFTQYYRTRLAARWCAFWNVRIASWGGTAELREMTSDKT